MLQWLRKAFRAAEKQPERSAELAELRESVSELQHAFKSIEFEWTEMYEKFNTLHARLSKRVKAESNGTATAGSQELTYAERLARARATHGNPFQR